MNPFVSITSYKHFVNLVSSFFPHGFFSGSILRQVPDIGPFPREHSSHAYLKMRVLTS